MMDEPDRSEEIVKMDGAARRGADANLITRGADTTGDDANSGSENVGDAEVGDAGVGDGGYPTDMAGNQLYMEKDYEAKKRLSKAGASVQFNNPQRANVRKSPNKEHQQSASQAARINYKMRQEAKRKADEADKELAEAEFAASVGDSSPSKRQARAAVGSIKATMQRSRTTSPEPSLPEGVSPSMRVHGIPNRTPHFSELPPVQDGASVSSVSARLQGIMDDNYQPSLSTHVEHPSEPDIHSPAASPGLLAPALLPPPGLENPRLSSPFQEEPYVGQADAAGYEEEQEDGDDELDDESEEHEEIETKKPARLRVKSRIKQIFNEEEKETLYRLSKEGYLPDGAKSPSKSHRVSSVLQRARDPAHETRQKERQLLQAKLMDTTCISARESSGDTGKLQTAAVVAKQKGLSLHTIPWSKDCPGAMRTALSASTYSKPQAKEANNIRSQPHDYFFGPTGNSRPMIDAVIRAPVDLLTHPILKTTSYEAGRLLPSNEEINAAINALNADFSRLKGESMHRAMLRGFAPLTAKLEEQQGKQLARVAISEQPAEADADVSENGSPYAVMSRASRPASMTPLQPPRTPRRLDDDKDQLSRPSSRSSSKGKQRAQPDPETPMSDRSPIAPVSVGIPFKLNESYVTEIDTFTKLQQATDLAQIPSKGKSGNKFPIGPAYDLSVEDGLRIFPSPARVKIHPAGLGRDWQYEVNPEMDTSDLPYPIYGFSLEDIAPWQMKQLGIWLEPVVETFFFAADHIASFYGLSWHTMPASTRAPATRFTTRRGVPVCGQRADATGAYKTTSKGRRGETDQSASESDNPRSRKKTKDDDKFTTPEFICRVLYRLFAEDGARRVDESWQLSDQPYRFLAEQAAARAKSQADAAAESNKEPIPAVETQDSDDYDPYDMFASSSQAIPDAPPSTSYKQRMEAVGTRIASAYAKKHADKLALINLELDARCLWRWHPSDDKEPHEAGIGDFLDFLEAPTLPLPSEHLVNVKRLHHWVVQHKARGLDPGPTFQRALDEVIGPDKKNFGNVWAQMLKRKSGQCYDDLKERAALVKICTAVDLLREAARKAEPGEAARQREEERRTTACLTGVQGENAADNAEQQIGALLDPEAHGIAVHEMRDPVEQMLYLGFGPYQDQTIWEKQVKTDKAKAHQVVLDDEGKPKLDQRGNPVFVNPELRRLRTQIVWPGFRPARELSPERIATLQAEGKDPEDFRERLVPQGHQISAVAVILARGYCLPEREQNAYFSTLLCDEMGLGKTWIGAMLITALRFVREQIQLGAHPEVTRNYKREFWTGEDPEDQDKLFKDPISKQQPQLIGDSRFSRVGARSETSRLRKHLFLAPKTICVVQHASLSNLLDPRYFARIDYNDFLFPNAGQRAAVWQKIRKSEDKLEVVIFCSYSRAEAEARLRPHTTDRSYNSTLLDPDIFYDTLFCDEIAEARNSERPLNFVIRRFAARSGLVVGASATPIYVSPHDLLNVARAIDMPFLFRDSTRPKYGVAPLPPKTDSSDGSVPPSSVPKLKRLNFDDCNAQIVKITQHWEDHARAISREKSRITSMLKAMVANVPDKKGRKEYTEAQEEEAAIVLETNEARASWSQPPFIAKEQPEQAQARMSILLAIRKIMSEVLDPLKKILAPWIIRRMHTTKCRYDGTTLTNIRPCVPTVCYLDMTGEQKDHFDGAVRVHHATSRPSQFQTFERMAMKDVVWVTEGHWDPEAVISAVMEWAAQELVEKLIWNETPVFDPSLNDGKGGMRDKYDSEKCKIVLYTPWASCLLPMQLILMRLGIFTSSLTGKLSEAERMERIAEFQADADHTPDNLDSYFDSKKEQFHIYRPKPGRGARVMFITDVSAAGITLTRARYMLLLDVLWTWSQLAQILARINRIGQLSTVECKICIVNGTHEARMYAKTGRRRDYASQFDALSQVVVEGDEATKQAYRDAKSDVEFAEDGTFKRSDAGPVNVDDQAVDSTDDDLVDYEQNRVVREMMTTLYDNTSNLPLMHRTCLPVFIEDYKAHKPRANAVGGHFEVFVKRNEPHNTDYLLHEPHHYPDADGCIRSIGAQHPAPCETLEMLMDLQRHAATTSNWALLDSLCAASIAGIIINRWDIQAPVSKNVRTARVALVHRNLFYRIHHSNLLTASERNAAILNGFDGSGAIIPDGWFEYPNTLILSELVDDLASHGPVGNPYIDIGLCSCEKVLTDNPPAESNPFFSAMLPPIVGHVINSLARTVGTTQTDMGGPMPVDFSKCTIRGKLETNIIALQSSHAIVMARRAIRLFYQRLLRFVARTDLRSFVPNDDEPTGLFALLARCFEILEDAETNSYRSRGVIDMEGITFVLCTHGHLSKLSLNSNYETISGVRPRDGQQGFSHCKRTRLTLLSMCKLLSKVDIPVELGCVCKSPESLFQHLCQDDEPSAVVRKSTSWFMSPIEHYMLNITKAGTIFNELATFLPFPLSKERVTAVAIRNYRKRAAHCKKSFYTPEDGLAARMDTWRTACAVLDKDEIERWSPYFTTLDIDPYMIKGWNKVFEYARKVNYAAKWWEDPRFKAINGRDVKPEITDEGETGEEDGAGEGDTGVEDGADEDDGHGDSGGDDTEEEDDDEDSDEDDSDEDSDEDSDDESDDEDEEDGQTGDENDDNDEEDGDKDGDSDDDNSDADNVATKGGVKRKSAGIETTAMGKRRRKE